MSDLTRRWDFDGRWFEPYQGGRQQGWEFDQPMPLPVMAKIIGVIR